MKLKEDVKKKLLQSENIGLLMNKTGKSYFTVKKWMDEDDEKLTQHSVKKAICEVLELPENEIFEQEDIRQTFDNI